MPDLFVRLRLVGLKIQKSVMLSAARSIAHLPHQHFAFIDIKISVVRVVVSRATGHSASVQMCFKSLPCVFQYDLDHPSMPVQVAERLQIGPQPDCHIAWFS
jgi:hypothetical protein